MVGLTKETNPFDGIGNGVIEGAVLTVELYRFVCQGLRANGTFLISFITPPEQWQPNQASALEFQRLLLQRAIPARWNCLRDESQTRQQLQDAGFEVVEVHYDSQRMFPTAMARKC